MLAARNEETKEKIRRIHDLLRWSDWTVPIAPLPGGAGSSSTITTSFVS
jgi:hypothetical protein